MDGQKFKIVQTPYQLNWGFNRGDRKGMFDYNSDKKKVLLIWIGTIKNMIS